MRRLSDVEPPRLIEALLKEIGDTHPVNLRGDDVAVRFFRSMIASINHQAEHPPLPDAHLANTAALLSGPWDDVVAPSEIIVIRAASESRQIRHFFGLEPPTT
jgi:hypothetical protein